MRARSYPKYKPTAVEWLGDMPEHWDAKRLKGSARYWVSNVDKIPADDEEPIRLCNYTDVYYNDHIAPGMGLMESTATHDEIRRFGLHVGDVLITKDSEEWSDIAVPALVVQTAPDLVCGYHLAIIRPDERVLLSRYLLRAFQAGAVNQQFQVAATGVTRYGLPKGAIGEAWVPMPPLDEQRAIADFLDRETAKIDSLVAKKRTLIDRLKERRTALISRTVTRGLPPDAARSAGLDPYPKFKPSGIDWLNDVPEHWEVAQLRRFTRFITSGSRGWAEYYADEGAIFVRITNLTRDSIRIDLSDLQHVDPPSGAEGERTRVVVGDVLFSITAYLGSVGVVDGTTAGAYINQHIALVRLDLRSVASRFIGYAALADVGQTQLAGQAYGGTKIQLALDDVKSLWLPIPPLLEQRSIADFLDLEMAKIDRMVAKVETATECLLEYRTALITAAVTGKIDVRGTSPSAVARG